MRLPIPGPSDVVAAWGRGTDQLDALFGAVPRVLELLPQAEELLVRASAAIDRVVAVTDEAGVVVTRTSGVVDRAAAQVARLTPLLDGLEPPLTKLQPTLEVLADTTHPDEVAALIRLVDHLPELTTRMEEDVMPVMATLGSVAPDIHDLLAVSRELNDMLAKLPGVGRIKRRIDEQQGEDGTTARVRD